MTSSGPTAEVPSVPLGSEDPVRPVGPGEVVAHPIVSGAVVPERPVGPGEVVAHPIGSSGVVSEHPVGPVTGPWRTVVPQPLRSVLQLPTWVSPVAPGTLAPQTVAIDQPTLQAAVVSALATPYAPAGAVPPAQVIWYDHDGDVLVHIDATVVSLFSGLVLVALTLETNETGLGQLSVPLTVGTPAQPVGLVVGTELSPRGPSLLVDRWGEAATAAAWRALMDVAGHLAAQGGADSNGVPFIPVSMTATPQQFAVLPQARQAMDSVEAP